MERDDSARCVLFVGRGNGKSELATAIICCVLYLDDEPGAPLYSAAAKRDQTHFIFDPAKKMIRACPQMNDRAQLQRLDCRRRSGLQVHQPRGDFRAWRKHPTLPWSMNSPAQPDRDLVDVLYTSTIKRRNPLLLYVTTSDFERPGSICNEKHDYACKVRDGIIKDPSFLRQSSRPG